MPCDSRVYVGQEIEERRKQVLDSVAKLERALGTGTVKVVIGPQGAVTFAGWTDGRNDVTDLCAYRRLSASGSWALRQAVAKAEALSGRQVDRKAVASGVHSHDGGGSWHPGHKK